MRIVLILAAIILGVLGLFVFKTDPPPKASKPAPVAKQTVAATPTPTPTAPKRRAPSRPEPADASPPPAEVADAALPVDASKDESGLYSFSLGTHRVKLKGDGETFLSAEIVIKTPSATARDHTRRLRNKLVGMYFFLVSKRVADSARAEDGQSRLEKDLLTRFGNVIRGGPLESVELVGFEVVESDDEPE